ncbi:MAG TPA: hypothetical protein VFD42_02120, partial [Chloroflexota bacterium]|nr:hypothetical protein [Chloroflexota bacterium]
MNKRKRVAMQKHRVKSRKLEEKRKMTRVASGISASRPRATESERAGAPARPAAPRRPRTAPHVAPRPAA